MRSNEIVRAKNYIKKHERRKRWIAFALCLSLLTGTLTMYGLNKPATAMTADGAKKLGVVLETANSEFEEGLIEETLQNKESSEAGESQDPEDGISKGTDAEGTSEVNGGSDNAGGNPDEGKEIAAEGEGSEDSSKSNETAETDPESGTEEEGNEEEAISSDDEEEGTEEKDSELLVEEVKVNEKEEFVFENGEFKVTAKLSNPESLPEGVELMATLIDRNTEGYNYKAYLDVLDENSKEIADALGQEEVVEHNEYNTLLMDMAFMLDGVEYEPAEGTVSVSIEFTNSSISDELNASSEDCVAVIHLPLDEKVMESVDSTKDATEITSDDINLEVLTESEIGFGEDGDNISFVTDSFSVVAVSTSLEGGDKTWYGQGLDDNTVAGIISALGNNIYFGVVGNYFTSKAEHFESNLAVTELGEINNETLFDYDNKYINTEIFKNYKIKLTKKSTKPGTFYFGIYGRDLNSDKLIKTVSIDVSSDDYDSKSEYYTDSIVLSDITQGGNGKIFIYELDGPNGSVVTDSYEDFTVTYSSDFGDGNDAIDALLSSYITKWNRSDEVLNEYLHQNSTVYYTRSESDTSYNKLTKNTPVETIEGPLPVKASNLLEQAKAVSQNLPYAKSENGVSVINMQIAEPDYMDAFYESYGSKLSGDYKWGDRNDVFNPEKGIRFDGDLLIMNLDLTAYDEYTIGQYYVNGVDSSADFHEIDSHIIINPVKYVDGRFVPYDGKLIIKNTLGTILAPCAEIHEEEINGALIGDRIYHDSGEIHKNTLIRGKEVQGEVTVTNTGEEEEKDFDLELHKYLYNKDPGNNRFDFWVRMYDVSAGGQNWSEAKGTAEEVDAAHIISNTGPDITYRVDPKVWNMKYGNTYIFRFYESPYKYDRNKDSKDNDSDYADITRDSAVILAKVEYISPDDIRKTYYRITDKDACTILRTTWEGKKAPDYCIDKYLVTDSKAVAFYNTRNITIEAVKHWDELVGPPLTNEWAPDNIFDIVLEVKRRVKDSSGEYESLVPEVSQVIKAPNNTDGDMGDYPENWNYYSNPVVFKDLPVKDGENEYEYTIVEYYLDSNNKRHELKLDKNGSSLDTTVNGFKQTDYKVTEVEGGYKVEITNTPYLLIQKEWRQNDQKITDTTGFNPVFVHLYQSYDGSADNPDYQDKVYKNSSGKKIGQRLCREVGNGGMIELRNENNWTVELKVPRKYSAERQFVYTMVECSANGTEYENSVSISYESIRRNNATRNLATDEDAKGYKDRVVQDSDWRNVFVQGNYPKIVLRVINQRGDNVLPQTGGIGDIPFKTTGLFLAMLSLIGAVIYSAIQKKNKVQRRGKGNERN